MDFTKNIYIPKTQVLLSGFTLQIFPIEYAKVLTSTLDTYVHTSFIEHVLLFVIPNADHFVLYAC